jgi:manganese transport protein
VLPAAEPPLRDPYALHPDEVAEPPRQLGAILGRIGPGLILCASIVGSGELIATTTLGAEVGYTALWVILLSCFVKPAIQAELGRYSIATGETGLAGFNRLPGPRWKVSWAVWAWLGMICMTRMQIGAMFGGVAQVLAQLWPGVPINLWIVGLLALTLALLLGGGYERIERLATIKVALFTMLTVLCAILLTRQPDEFSWGEVWKGLQFELPKGGLTSAVAVFGITGVGAAELFMYPYWCVEKGYARRAGRRDGSTAWKTRVAGWSRVMHVDILASMFIYTLATIAFYLLGAGILNKRGLVPAANDMIPVLSNIYTQSLGSWALWLFYVGAIATLYGTIFAATAAESRVAADFCRLMGLFQADDYAARVHFRRIFVVLLTVVPACLIVLVHSPVTMVKAGGVAQAMMLPVIAATALYLRYRAMPKEVITRKWLTVGLWLASSVTIVLMGYYTLLLIQ